MIGVFLGVEGDITGSMMFLVEQNSAKHLLHKILGDMVQPEGFSEIEFSAMQEIGNIITGAYLNSLSILNPIPRYYRLWEYLLHKVLRGRRRGAE